MSGYIFDKNKLPLSLLVLGGARSGKSTYAQNTAEAFSKAELTKEKLYIATAEAQDDEMRHRIHLHQETRGDGWRTLEVPLDLAGTIEREATLERILLVDCLTLWLANMMGVGCENLPQEYTRLCHAITHSKGSVILVSNETGSGIVPDNPLARAFRDEQGRLNQQVAQACSTVALIVAGLPLLLKE